MTFRLQRLKALLFENRSLRQTAFKNTFWLTMSNFLGRIIRAALLIYVARVLGAAGYGVFSYAVGIAALFSIFSDIGVNGILTREGAKNPKAFPEYLATSLILKILLLIATNLILLLAIPYVTAVPEALPLLPLAALLVTLDGLRDLTFSITRAEEKMHLEAIINITTNLAITLIGLGLLFFSPTPKSLMVGYTVGSGIGTITAFVILRRHFRRFWDHIRPRLMAPILREGFLFGMMGFLGTIMLNTDTVMIGWLANASALGLYAASQRPIQVLYVFPAIMSTALFPAFSRFAETEKERFRSLLEKAISFSLLVAIPLVLGGLALRDGVILLLFGEQYRGAVLSFYLLLTTILITFPGVFIGNAIFAANKQKLFTWFLVLGAIGNAFFNYLLIPRYGIAGSAVATIIAQVLSNGFSWWKLKGLTGFRVLPYILKITLASVVMSIVVYLFHAAGMPVILNLILAAPVYFGLLAVLREPLLSYFIPASLRRQNPVG
jgi:O-antigen/teichoic acid export membrane protein